MRSDGITVIDVMRDLRVEITPRLSWAVGEAVRDLYYSRNGVLPPKSLRAKTSGAGTHCFAIYPESMRAEIEQVVRDNRAEAARQFSLF